MLTRRPETGEVLEYDPTVAGGVGPVRRYRVDGIHASSEDILKVTDLNTGHQTTIIWQFGDGQLNKCLSHESTRGLNACARAVASERGREEPLDARGSSLEGVREDRERSP